jgi:hypothetical protein
MSFLEDTIINLMKVVHWVNDVRSFYGGNLSADDTISSHFGNGDQADVTPLPLTSNVPYPIPPKDPDCSNLATKEDIELLHTSILNMLRVEKRIYNILGGDFWYKQNNNSEMPTGMIDSETFIKNLVASQWGMQGEKQTVARAKANNLIDVFAIFQSAIYHRLGLQEFPLQAVNSLAAKPGEETDIKIPYLSKLLEYQIKQQDNVIGRFPVDIKIEDADAIAAGNQAEEYHFPNLSEITAELMSVTLGQNVMLNILFNICLRELQETGNTKLVCVRNNYAIDAIIDYLGFATVEKKEKIPFVFNPLMGASGEGNIAESLKPSEIETIISECSEKLTHEQKLGRLLKAAAITEAVNYRKLGTDGSALADRLKGLLNLSKELGKNDLSLEDWIKEVEKGFTDQLKNQSIPKPYGRNFDERPEIINEKPDTIPTSNPNP